MARVTTTRIIGAAWLAMAAVLAVGCARARVKSLTLMCTFADGKAAAPLTLRMLWLGSRTRIGTPSRASITISSTSARLVAIPMPWIRLDSPAWSSVPPPTFELFCSSASASRPSVRS